MCGIAGYLGPKLAQLPSINEVMRHRGPDGQGLWSGFAGDTHVHLWHRRLAIIDLSDASAQPMVDGGTGVVLSFNGEIYNFQELRRELESSGHVFHSTGDTEVLLRGYLEWGEHVLARLDGMFAFAIWDPRSRHLLIGRDHVGIKPLYYARTTDGGLLFSSEVRPIVASGLVKTSWSQAAVVDYLERGSIAEPRTMFEQISSLPPASYAVLEAHNCGRAPRPQTYWFPERIPLSSGRDAFERHREILSRTVSEQIVSDVTAGVFLSAGIDSTVLLETLDRPSRDRIRAFTIGGELAVHDEVEIAAETGGNLGVRHGAVRLGAGQLQPWVKSSLAAMDLPSADGVNVYLVSRAAREAGITVALAGTGADELHAGYAHYRALNSVSRFSGSTLGFGLGALRAASHGIRWFDKTRGERLDSLLQAAPSPSAMLNERRRFLTQAQMDGYMPGWRKVRRGPCFDEIADSSRDFLTALSVAEIRGYLCNTLLRDADWASMASSLELRVPYLGRRYMESVLSLPWSVKLGEADYSKPLLRGLVSPQNRNVLGRAKTGFFINYGDLITGTMREEATACLEAVRQRLGLNLDPAAEIAVLESRSQSIIKRARRVWAMIALGSYISRVH